MSFKIVSRQTLPQSRSVSSSSPAKRSPRPVFKSISSSALHAMAAAVSAAPGIPTPKHLSPYEYNDEEGLGTIPDPRSRAMSPANDNGPPSPSQHPDLSNEVATLSNKLINAINHTTNLDDTLSVTRHELEAARERLKQLELESSEHKDMVSRGILVRKAVADLEKTRLQTSLAEEKRQRGEVEKEKKSIELELENLTTALFEEANKMVSTAREEAQKEHDIVTRKNEQLKNQLADMESLLKSHQQQLAELKQVMEQMTEEHDDQSNLTEPSTPGLSKFDSKDDVVDTAEPTVVQEPVSPSYPTSFTHLLQPVLRTDLAAFEDFTSLLHMSKNTGGSRVSSGSYGAIGIGLGLGLGAYTGHGAANHAPSNGSTSSISTSGTFGSSPTTPVTPASTSSTNSTNGPNSLTPLKETKFYKRALAEDIEPTLRLDTAPGLSWLARRTVLNAMCDGTLVVEPMPSTTKLYTFACSLCGETRKDERYTRSYRFRTNESENAQRYPLCKYCLGRVRSSCDFLGFLRVLKDGHWRTDGEEAERAAWEESVRLREQMFWCRMGGGVVPTSHHQAIADTMAKSPRISEERKQVEGKASEELERTNEFKPRDITPIDIAAVVNNPKNPRIILDKDDTTEGSLEASQQDAESEEQVEVNAEENAGDKAEETAEEKEEDATADTDNILEEAPADKHDATRDSTLSTSSLNASPNESEKDEAKRLSITIPGAFD